MNVVEVTSMVVLAICTLSAVVEALKPGIYAPPRFIGSRKVGDR